MYFWCIFCVRHNTHRQKQTGWILRVGPRNENVDADSKIWVAYWVAFRNHVFLTTIITVRSGHCFFFRYYKPVCFFPTAVPPLTVQILPIAENGRFSGINDGPQSPPLTQSSAKIKPFPDDGGHSSVHGGDVQEQHQLQPLTAGRKYELPCRAHGSRPPAKLTWWMDGRRLDTTRETVRVNYLRWYCVPGLRGGSKPEHMPWVPIIEGRKLWIMWSVD